MEFDKDYQSQCTRCGDHNFQKAWAWINGLTHYTLIGTTYLAANQVKYIFEQIQKEPVNDCKCDCVVCKFCAVEEIG